MKRAVVASLVLVVAAVAAHLHVGMQTYFPVIRIAAPQGLVYTAWFDPTTERRACAGATRLFLDPVKESCAECEVVFARCERDAGDAASALEAAPGGHHAVSMSGLRIDITGPDAIARHNCDAMAGYFAKQGVSGVACEYRSR